MAATDVLKLAVRESSTAPSVIELLPLTSVTAVLVALVRAGAPQASPHLGRVVTISATEAILFVVAIFVATVLLQPLQQSVVAILEGYRLRPRVLQMWMIHRHQRARSEQRR